MFYIGFITIKQIIFKDVMEGAKIQDPYEQQLFFLSRFFNKPIKEIEVMSMTEVAPMMKELDNYIRKINIEKPTILSFSSTKDRYDILDL